MLGVDHALDESLAGALGLEAMAPAHVGARMLKGYSLCHSFLAVGIVFNMN